MQSKFIDELNQNRVELLIEMNVVKSKYFRVY